MSTKTTSIQDGTIVTNEVSIEVGDEVITNKGGSFDNWALTVIDKFDGADGNTWLKIKGDWDGARCYDVYFDHEKYKFRLARFHKPSKTIRVYKV